MLRPYTKEWLEELCAESYSYAEVLSKAGRKCRLYRKITKRNKYDRHNRSFRKR